MKKLFIFILIVMVIYGYIHKEESKEIANNLVDVLVSETVQDTVYKSYNATWDYIIKTTTYVDGKREQTKVWALSRSSILVSKAASERFVRENKSFSPILDNSNLVFSSRTTFGEKLLAVVLFCITFLFWNSIIFIIWVSLLLWWVVKILVQRFFPEKKDNFFDQMRGNKRNKSWD